MRIAICDDENHIRQQLAEKVKQAYPDAQVSCFGSGEELLHVKEMPDILFLDIQMNGKNGMETAQQLRKNERDMIIIFVTALEEYVFQSFDVGAFHYLVKPFDDRKFLEVLKNAVGQYQRNGQITEKKGGEHQKPLLISSGGSHIAVMPDEITYAEVFNRKVVIHTVRQTIEYYGKLKDLEQELGEDFYRPHRAYLVHFKYVRKYDAHNIYLEQGQTLLAKRNYSDFVKKYMRYNQRKGMQG